MRAFILTFFVLLGCAFASAEGADIPDARLQSTPLGENHQSRYYWQTTPVANTAELLTLFCRACEPNATRVNPDSDIPLVSVLRDTLGDNNPQNDRISYVWLLTYSRLDLGQRALAAVPFFYWRLGKGSSSATAGDITPLFDFAAPQHPVISELERDILQWTAFDPLTTPVRATSRAYRTNQIDLQRLHLAEAITYLRQAPVSSGDSALTQAQLSTVIARLELRKRLLGGLVTKKRATEIGEETAFEQERVRSRNWELLRQCAEKTGLFFEPLSVAGTSGQYAILWFPLHRSAAPNGIALNPVWKLLSIRNPWSDDHLATWNGLTYTRFLDENGALVPSNDPGSSQITLVPLAVYSLTYPKCPLLLVDFRDKLHVRWREMTQRSINEVTAGVIGISHFTNWYYYVAADMYDFVVERHGGAMNQAARLDCYSEFRAALALDRQLDPPLRESLEQRVDSLAVNPLGAAPARERDAAKARYSRLQSEAGADGSLAARLEKQRRAELAYFEESNVSRSASEFFHIVSFGLYTNRARADDANLAALDAYRRIESQLEFLDSLVESGTQPEIAYDRIRIAGSVAELNDLMPQVPARSIRAHAAGTLARLRALSQDKQVQAECALALLTLERGPTAVPPVVAHGASPRAPSAPDSSSSLRDSARNSTGVNSFK